MQPQTGTSFIKKSLTLSWAILCIVVAILIPGKLSVLHGIFLDNVAEPLAMLKSISMASYLGDLLLSLGEIALFSFACISAGVFFLSLAKLENIEKQDPFIFLALIGTSFMAGHWVLSSAFILLAISGNLTSQTVIWILAAATIVGAYPVFRQFIRPIWNRDISPLQLPRDKKYRILLGLSAGILLASLFLSTSRLGYDAVYIYFSDPKLTALSHRLRFFMNSLFVISSFQTGIQFSAIMLIFSDQAARLFSWTSGLVNILFGLALAHKAGMSSRAKTILLVLLLTSTAFTDLLGDAKVDLTSSAAAIAAVYWMFTADHKHHKLLAGFFAGLAMASRPYNIFLVGLFIASLYFIRMYINRNDPTKRGIRPLLESLIWIGIGAVPPMALHLVENQLVFGDMFAMFANTQNITAQNWQWALDPRYIWVMRLFYPLLVTFLSTSQSIGNISPLFLAFLPYVFYGELMQKLNLSRTMRQMLVAGLLTLVLWISLFFTILEIRYIFFLWIILFIASSEVIVIVLENTEKIFRRIFTVLTIVLMGFIIFRIAYIALDTYSPVDDQGNPQCSNYVLCDYLKPINMDASPGDRVLTLMAYRYYLRTDLFACSTRMEEYDRILETSKVSAEAFWIEAYRQGYTYVAYENNYSVRHLYMDLVPDPATTPEWMEVETLYGGPQEPVAAYRIFVHNPPVSQERECALDNEIWNVHDIP